MKAKTLIMASALLTVMTGCNKTDISTVVTPAGNNVILKAYVNNPATKVGFDSEGVFYWSEGDNLGVLDNGETPVFHEFKLKEGDKGKANGIFTGTFPDGTDFGTYAVYPYNANHSVSGDMLTYDFPASYNYDKVDEDHFAAVQGDGNSFNAPMWGKIEAGSVQMKHLGGVFCIKIDKMPCTSGTLTLTSDMKISGTYTVDLSATDPAITAAVAATDEEKTVSITFSNATAGSPGVFYVPAPVGKHNIRIVIKDNEGNERLTFNWTYNIARCGLQRADIFTLEGKICAFPFKMAYVKAGTFRMGAQKTDESGQNYDTDAHDDESPVHQVTLTEDYYMGKYEVTQGLWKAVMDGSNPSSFSKGDNYPVELVSYNKIVGEFIPKLNEMTGITGMAFTLPTEAQWEFAAAGGKAGYNEDGSRKHLYSGSNDVNAVAWYGYYDDPQGTAKDQSTYPVGQRQPNELGIYDMSGNVEEWCSDWYDATYYQTCLDAGTPVSDPAGPADGTERVLRGGGFNTDPVYIRVSNRIHFNPANSQRDYGFRLVLTVLP